MENLDVTATNDSCSSVEFPSIKDYFMAKNAVCLTFVVMGAGILLLISILFFDTTRHVIRNSPSRAKSHAIFVLALYPTVGLLYYIALIIPRASLVLDAISQILISIGLYQLFCSFVAYCGGESELAVKLKDTQLIMKVPPCCCWFCCSCLPSPYVTKNILRRLKILVLQQAVVQGFLYCLSIVFWVENPDLHETVNWCIQIFVIISITSGMWGLIMATRHFRTHMDTKFHFTQKFIMFQLILVLPKVTLIIVKSLESTHVLPCHLPFTRHVYFNVIYSGSVMLEVLLLLFATRIYYKRDLKSNAVDLNQRISTIFGTDQSDIEVNNKGIENSGFQ
ncbi:hypothetical protein ABEB36_005677 [Hypothenemus hampei]|uniref:Organic solute transporter subunit alpha n=1 Tax=Hypothenemus hampei TaxID=57062 RepID=A0ABD1F1P7_HYPHA